MSRVRILVQKAQRRLRATPGSTWEPMKVLVVRVTLLLCSGGPLWWPQGLWFSLWLSF